MRGLVAACLMAVVVFLGLYIIPILIMLGDDGSRGDCRPEPTGVTLIGRCDDG